MTDTQPYPPYSPNWVSVEVASVAAKINQCRGLNSYGVLVPLTTLRTLFEDRQQPLTAGANAAASASSGEKKEAVAGAAAASASVSRYAHLCTTTAVEAARKITAGSISTNNSNNNKPGSASSSSASGFGVDVLLSILQDSQPWATAIRTGLSQIGDSRVPQAACHVMTELLSLVEEMLWHVNQHHHNHEEHHEGLHDDGHQNAEGLAFLIHGCCAVLEIFFGRPKEDSSDGKQREKEKKPVNKKLELIRAVTGEESSSDDDDDDDEIVQLFSELLHDYSEDILFSCFSTLAAVTQSLAALEEAAISIMAPTEDESKNKEVANNNPNPFDSSSSPRSVLVWCALQLQRHNVLSQATTLLTRRAEGLVARAAGSTHTTTTTSVLKKQSTTTVSGENAAAAEDDPDSNTLNNGEESGNTTNSNSPPRGKGPLSGFQFLFRDEDCGEGGERIGDGQWYDGGDLVADGGYPSSARLVHPPPPPSSAGGGVVGGSGVSRSTSRDAGAALSRPQSTAAVGPTGTASASNAGRPRTSSSRPSSSAAIPSSSNRRVAIASYGEKAAQIVALGLQVTAWLHRHLLAALCEDETEESEEGSAEEKKGQRMMKRLHIIVAGIVNSAQRLKLRDTLVALLGHCVGLQATATKQMISHNNHAANGGLRSGLTSAGSTGFNSARSNFSFSGASSPASSSALTFTAKLVVPLLFVLRYMVAIERQHVEKDCRRAQEGGGLAKGGTAAPAPSCVNTRAVDPFADADTATMASVGTSAAMQLSPRDRAMATLAWLQEVLEGALLPAVNRYCMQLLMVLKGGGGGGGGGGALLFDHTNNNNNNSNNGGSGSIGGVLKSRKHQVLLLLRTTEELSLTAGCIIDSGRRIADGLMMAAEAVNGGAKKAVDDAGAFTMYHFRAPHMLNLVRKVLNVQLSPSASVPATARQHPTAVTPSTVQTPFPPGSTATATSSGGGLLSSPSMLPLAVASPFSPISAGGSSASVVGQLHFVPSVLSLRSTLENLPPELSANGGLLQLYTTTATATADDATTAAEKEELLLGTVSAPNVDLSAAVLSRFLAGASYSLWTHIMYPLLQGLQQQGCRGGDGEKEEEEEKKKSSAIPDARTATALAEALCDAMTAVTSRCSSVVGHVLALPQHSAQLQPLRPMMLPPEALLEVLAVWVMGRNMTCFDEAKWDNAFVGGGGGGGHFSNTTAANGGAKSNAQSQRIGSGGGVGGGRQGLLLRSSLAAAAAAAAAEVDTSGAANNSFGNSVVPPDAASSASPAAACPLSATSPRVWLLSHAADCLSIVSDREMKLYSKVTKAYEALLTLVLTSMQKLPTTNGANNSKQPVLRLASTSVLFPHHQSPLLPSQQQTQPSSLLYSSSSSAAVLPLPRILWSTMQFVQYYCIGLYKRLFGCTPRMPSSGDDDDEEGGEGDTEDSVLQQIVLLNSALNSTTIGSQEQQQRSNNNINTIAASDADEGAAALQLMEARRSATIHLERVLMCSATHVPSILVRLLQFCEEDGALAIAAAASSNGDDDSDEDSTVDGESVLAALRQLTGATGSASGELEEAVCPSALVIAQSQRATAEALVELMIDCSAQTLGFLCDTITFTNSSTSASSPVSGGVPSSPPNTTSPHAADNHHLHHRHPHRDGSGGAQRPSGGSARPRHVRIDADDNSNGGAKRAANQQQQKSYGGDDGAAEDEDDDTLNDSLTATKGAGGGGAGAHEGFYNHHHIPLNHRVAKGHCFANPLTSHVKDDDDVHDLLILTVPIINAVLQLTPEVLLSMPAANSTNSNNANPPTAARSPQEDGHRWWLRVANALVAALQQTQEDGALTVITLYALYNALSAMTTRATVAVQSSSQSSKSTEGVVVAAKPFTGARGVVEALVELNSLTSTASSSSSLLTSPSLSSAAIDGSSAPPPANAGGTPLSTATATTTTTTSQPLVWSILTRILSLAMMPTSDRRGDDNNANELVSAVCLVVERLVLITRSSPSSCPSSGGGADVANSSSDSIDGNNNNPLARSVGGPQHMSRIVKRSTPFLTTLAAVAKASVDTALRPSTAAASEVAIPPPPRALTLLMLILEDDDYREAVKQCTAPAGGPTDMNNASASDSPSLALWCVLSNFFEHLVKSIDAKTEQQQQPYPPAENSGAGDNNGGSGSTATPAHYIRQQQQSSTAPSSSSPSTSRFVQPWLYVKAQTLKYLSE